MLGSSGLGRRTGLWLGSMVALAALAAPGPAAAEDLNWPVYRGPDLERERIPVVVEHVRAGGKKLRFRVPVDLGLMPGSGDPPRVLVVAERCGDLEWVHLDDGRRGRWLRIRPSDPYPEGGLLGFAFHPRFPEDPRVFTYHTDPRGKAVTSVVTAWELEGDTLEQTRAVRPVEVFRLQQPADGHHAGQIVFGPDGMLYVALGDGGFQGDPGNRVQDPTLFYGKMLRLDVDRTDPGKRYAIPPDNPYVGGPYLPEVWAVGLRNPWRFSFVPDGRLVVGDVGWDRWEEINVVEKGGNYGWSFREGSQCILKSRKREGSCEDPKFIDPIYAYSHSEGAAVIGGRVYTSEEIPQLYGKYLFADYRFGRLWAMDLPPPGESDGARVYALGDFDHTWTTFGAGPRGEVWGATHGGAIVRIAPQPPR